MWLKNALRAFTPAVGDIWTVGVLKCGGPLLLTHSTSILIRLINERSGWMDYLQLIVYECLAHVHRDKHREIIICTAKMDRCSWRRALWADLRHDSNNWPLGKYKYTQKVMMKSKNINSLMDCITL